MDKKNIKYVSDTEFFEMLNSMKHFSYEDMKDQKSWFYCNYGMQRM